MSTSFYRIVPSALQQPHVALLTALAVSGVILVTVLRPVLFSSKRSTGIHELGGLPILTTWPFFKWRYDFLKSHFAKTGEKMFSFKVFNHSVTALRGEDSRKAFFDNKSFSFTEGYKITGALPLLENIDKLSEDLSWLSKLIAVVLRKDRLADVIPTLFDDVQRRMEGWGKEGCIDPFKNVYDLVFQMTVRMATCRELASDVAMLNKLQHDYWMLEKSATPTTLLFPWLPAAKKKKENAKKSLYTTLHDFVEMRRAAEVPTSDAIDVLLAQGLSNDLVITFVLNVIFAGVINTGVNACWALLFLSFHPEWKTKVTAEVRTLIETHTNSSSSDLLHKRLSMIPISAWEEEMPVMEAVIRETIRIVLNTTALRRNVLGNLDVMGKTIPNGHFLAYPFSDVHLNPDIYTNPTEFDPSRFGPGREEDKRQTFGYLGWGGGRHPCTGMKVAKLEMKIIIALFVAGYEHKIVNSEGKLPERLPTPDYNDIHQQRPVGDPCFIQFKRIVD